MCKGDEINAELERGNAVVIWSGIAKKSWVLLDPCR